MADKTILVRHFSNMCALMTKLLSVPNYKWESRVGFPDKLVACIFVKIHLGKEGVYFILTS